MRVAAVPCYEAANRFTNLASPCAAASRSLAAVLCPRTEPGALQRRALCAAQRSSPPCVGGLPRCSPARCWHEGRSALTTAQTVATCRPASPPCCAPCARDWAFVWRRSTATPRSRAHRSRSGETACSPVISQCSYAQTPAPAVPALGAPLFRRSPSSILGTPRAPSLPGRSPQSWASPFRPKTAPRREVRAQDHFHT